MKRSILMTTILLSCCFCYSQNLVPNPGFEDTLNVYCGIFLPYNFNASVHSWNTPTQGTPDLFCTQISQTCWNYQPNSTYSGGICLKGSQMPHTGNVFAGIGCYSIPGLNQRDYIQSPLTTPLVAGENYLVSFYVSLADNTENYTDKIGAYFSVSPVTSLNDQPLPYAPQISATSFISDTANWVLVSGIFQATSAFNYITIGNFYADSLTTTLNNPNGGTGPGCYGAYYFIDDVSVSEITTGINNMNKEADVILFPNPFSERLYFSSNKNKVASITLYDITSRKILQKEVENELYMNTPNLDPGIYTYEVIFRDGKTSNGKVMKYK